MDDPVKFLNSLFEVAVKAALPQECLPAYLPKPSEGRSIVIGAGKASAAMAEVVERHWTKPMEGLVITRYGFHRPCNYIEIVQASHPIPDEAGLKAAGRMLGYLEGLTEDDLVLCLISGGGSALLTLPADNIAFKDKQMVNEMLVKCGAPISEINTVRKHLSAVKGGRLGQSCMPARLHTLIISDVPGDDPSLVASGPTIPDTSKVSDALAILEKYDLSIPSSVLEHLKGKVEEKEGVSFFGTHSIIGSSKTSLEAAKSHARNHGIGVTVLGDAMEGESRVVGQNVAQLVLRENKQKHVYLSGGETTVTVNGRGRGGPNAEFLLGLALKLDGAKNVYALACDTDGIDGSEDNAGAIVKPDTLHRAHKSGLDAKTYLENNDVYTFFEGLGDLVITGPTYTNVNDFRAILVL